MFLAEIRIHDFRCFADLTVQFRPGVNVLLGENKAGKTTVIKAFGLLLDLRARRRPTFFDFSPSDSGLDDPACHHCVHYVPVV
jgi:putative ATP-dependent endonuclease of OLD family